MYFLKKMLVFLWNCYISLGMLKAGQTDTSNLTPEQIEEARQVWNRIWIDQGPARQGNYITSGGQSFGD